VGIDNSAAMLARARQNCSDNVILHLTDAEQLDFPDGYFDCAIISFSLHEKHETLRELIYTSVRRVIRQGGSLIICDYSGNPVGLKGTVLGHLAIPIIERLAGRLHYRNYLSWMRQGGLELFLQQRCQAADIISRRFGGAALCCAVTIDDELRAYQKHIALLNQSLPARPPESEPRP
jgi:demethylmenaquinone methyltransferase/2-methoxy-6-polyprenyl-1,4-benzoquinol methylase